jgi:hypothetical protein
MLLAVDAHNECALAFGGSLLIPWQQWAHCTVHWTVNRAKLHSYNHLQQTNRRLDLCLVMPLAVDAHNECTLSFGSSLLIPRQQWAHCMLHWTVNRAKLHSYDHLQQTPRRALTYAWISH